MVLPDQRLLLLQKLQDLLTLHALGKEDKRLVEHHNGSSCPRTDAADTYALADFVTRRGLIGLPLCIGELPPHGSKSAAAR